MRGSHKGLFSGVREHSRCYHWSAQSSHRLVRVVPWGTIPAQTPSLRGRVLRVGWIIHAVVAPDRRVLALRSALVRGDQVWAIEDGFGRRPVSSAGSLGGGAPAPAPGARCGAPGAAGGFGAAGGLGAPAGGFWAAGGPGGGFFCCGARCGADERRALSIPENSCSLRYEALM